jgi:hypothetical protein
MRSFAKKGYKCITVPEKIHKEIKKRSKETNHSLKEYVEYLLAKDKTSRET